MDFSFWAGIILGALVGFPVSIVANLYSDSVREYLNQRKVLKLNKRRSKEIAVHRRIQNLINGDPREQLLLAEQRTFILLSTIMLIFCCGAALFLFSQNELVNLAPKTGRFFGALLFLLAGAVFSGMGAFLLADLRDTMRKIYRFPEYEQKIRERWGEDAI